LLLLKHSLILFFSYFMSEAPRTLSQEDFDRYKGKWLDTVATGRPTDLEQYLFDPETKKPIPAVFFSAEQIGWLVSTVGAKSIEARFVLVTAQEQPAPYFAVVLYAADKDHLPLSAYLLSSPASKLPSPYSGTISSGDSLGTVQVPHYQASLWISYWATTLAANLAPAMFATKFGTLEGYSYGVGDWLNMLFDAQPAPLASGAPAPDSREVQLDLCLHEYYTAAQRDTPTHTFGLVLRLLALAPDPTTGKVESGEPFYDMSTPCPPNI
jgi:hypothetical protein